MEVPGNREEEGGLWLTEEVGERRIVEAENNDICKVRQKELQNAFTQRWLRFGSFTSGLVTEEEETQLSLSTVSEIQKLTSRMHKSFQEAVSQLSNGWATTGETFARAKPSGDALIQCADGLPQETFKICKEFLRPYKKCLRKLNLPKDLPEKKRVNITRKNVIILGDHIDMFLQHYCKKWELKHWKRVLWRFVSLFSSYDERQLSKLYRYSKTNQMDKFLKTFGCLEGLGSLALSKNKDLKKLRKAWGLPGEEKAPEKISQPVDNVSKKWLHKTSSTPGRQGDVDQNEVVDNQPGSPPSTSRGQEVSSVAQNAISEIDP